MKKIGFGLVTVILCLGLVWTVGAKDVEIAVIPLSLGHPWWVRCEEGAKKAAQDLGIKVVFTAPEREDAARQLDFFKDQVNRGVDAIVLAAVDAEAMAKPISDAIKKGIPVFGFDIGAPGTEVIWTASGWEPTQSGINIGKGLAEEIGYKGKVAILTGGLGSPFLAKRQQAIEKVLSEYPEISIVGVFANDNDYEKALSQCESILQAHPDLAGFASTVTTGVPAAVQALVNAGLAGKVAVWGVALPKQNAEAVKKGWVKGALALDPAQMTYLGVQIAYNYLISKSLPEPGQDFGWAGVPVTIPEERFSYVPDTLLTPENVDIFDF
ncbi:MAG: autoinducer 2 ABC transporter substrate-binding protein [Atribacterota bacterium]